jgi:glucose/arabinose dehydrogenase/PKD repeat protein
MALAFACAPAVPANAVTLPPGFQQTKAIGNLERPMDVEIAPNGRVFVAEKSGIVKTYTTLSDTSATVFADLRTQVHNYSNRGLLGLAVDPAFPANPYVYVYYTLDAPVGGAPPVFGVAGQTQDLCPGSLDAINCVVSARVSRLRFANEQVDGPEQVLVNDWCQQFAYHAGGGIEFGADGYLYVSSGDGARWGTWDYGQLGNPTNACGDPPGGIGDPMTAPTAEGGRLRAQDLRTGGDPLGLAGSLIRIDPATGVGAPDNPRSTSADPNERRMLAYGLRNSARLAIRPGTNDVWLGDWGGGYWEEINRVPQPSDPIRNFGWPCYEGGVDLNGVPYARVRPRSDDQELAICEGLYAETSATAAPYWAYDHELEIVPGEDCSIDESANEPGGKIWGMAFYPSGGNFPAAYRGALFFGDELRQCIWAMLPGADGLPQRGRVVPFVQAAASPFDIEVAPNGDLLWIDDDASNVKRIQWVGNAANQAPTALAAADAVTGTRPLTVTFDSSGSSDPDAGDVLTREWDLDGDGEFDDSTAAHPQHTYLNGGVYTVALRVTDTSGATHTDTLTVTVTSGPVASIDTPAAGATWKAGDTISFSGSANDEEDGTLPAAALDWSVVLVDCAAPGDCHEDGLGTFDSRQTGSISAPDHPEPAHIQIRLTATDSGGETHTDSVRLDPQVANLALTADPAGAAVILNDAAVTTPVTKQIVVGSQNTLTAATQQTFANTTYRFSSWSDGQPRARTLTMPAAGAAYHATFAPFAPGSRTLSFAAEADARVEQPAPSSNFGTSNSLRMDQATGAAEDIDTYMRFAVEGITGRIASAKLRLRSTGNTISGVAVHTAGGGWTETGINWTNQPPFPPGSIAQVVGIEAQQWVEWDVTSAVMGDGAVNLRLTPTGDDGVTFHSREASNQTLRPQLVVTVVNDAHVRPKGATETKFSLVPAYRECNGANRTHGPPLVHPSCSPPAQASGELTMGTADANGATTNSVGSAAFKVLAGTASTAADEADVRLQISITDVRQRTGLTDYTGSLLARTTTRVTDRADGTSTIADISLPVNVPCVGTPAGVGATCAVNTTLDALNPGTIDEGARAVWELVSVELLDSGGEVFARPGVFIP